MVNSASQVVQAACIAGVPKPCLCTISSIYKKYSTSSTGNSSGRYTCTTGQACLELLDDDSISQACSGNCGGVIVQLCLRKGCDQAVRTGRVWTCRVNETTDVAHSVCQIEACHLHNMYPIKAERVPYNVRSMVWFSLNAMQHFRPVTRDGDFVS